MVDEFADGRLLQTTAYLCAFVRSETGLLTCMRNEGATRVVASLLLLVIGLLPLAQETPCLRWLLTTE
jgi:hypothetical protein